MKSTNQYLDEIKIKHDLKSDFALSKMLKVVPSAMANYRKGYIRFGDDTAIRVAEALEIDPAEVMATMNAERTKSPNARETWKRVAQHFAKQAHKEADTDLAA